MKLLSAFMLCCIFANIEALDEELVQVLIFSRHGDRTPNEPYPSDPWRSSMFWPEGWMKLTPEGREQMKNYGRMIRNRYFDFLDANFTESSVTVKSTDTSRTIQSASSFMSGLYPKQAVPIYVTPEQYDDVFNAHKRCPAYDEEIEDVKRSRENRAEEEQRAPLYENLTYLLGKSVYSLQSMEKLYSILFIENNRGLDLPRWTRLYFPEPLRTLAGKSLVLGASTKTSSRLRYGTIYKDILNMAINSGTYKGPKFVYYSGHDTNLVGMTKILDSYNEGPPGFAASMLFEIYHDKAKQEKKVKIFFRNDFKSAFNLIHIPECINPCPLLKLQQILDPFIPKNIAKECNRESDSNDSNDKLTFFVACLGSAAIGAVLVICSSKIFSRGYRDESDERRCAYIEISRNEPRSSAHTKYNSLRLIY